MAKKEINKSLDISGEVVSVLGNRQAQYHHQQQQRPNTQQQQQQQPIAFDTLGTVNKNGVLLTHDQLETLLTALKSAGANSSKEAVPLPKSRRSTDLDLNNDDDDYPAVRHFQPRIVISEENDEAPPRVVDNGAKQAPTSLMDKKRLKWQQDIETSEKLGKQDQYDQQKVITYTQTRNEAGK